MKRLGFVLIAAALLAGALGGCEFLMGPNEPVGGGNLVINFRAGDGRAITSGAELPGDVLAAMRYELTLTGPGGETFTRTVAEGEDIRLSVALGVWRLDARAYNKGGLAGTKSMSITVVPGVNSVSVPMDINEGYFSVTVDSGIRNGTLRAGFTDAFPGTAVTLTVTPDAGYALKAGSLAVNGGAVLVEGNGPGYTFTMPASDVTVSAFFNRDVGFVIEGPQDEVIAVSAEHSAGRMPATEISWSAGEQVTFTLGDSPYTAEAGSLKWFVNGAERPGSGNSLTVSARDYSLRAYFLTVMVLKDGGWYSTEIRFEVKE